MIFKIVGHPPKQKGNSLKINFQLMGEFLKEKKKMRKKQVIVLTENSVSFGINS